MHPPLSSAEFHTASSVDMCIFAFHLLGVSSLLNGLNAIGTCIAARSYSVSMLDYSLFM